MRGKTVSNVTFLFLMAVLVVSLGYLLLAEETVTIDVQVEDQRYRNVDDQVVMVSKVDDYTKKRCNPRNAMDFAYVNDGEATFHFNARTQYDISFEFCSPYYDKTGGVSDREVFTSSATFEVDHLQSGISEYPTENLRFYVENVTVR